MTKARDLADGASALSAVSATELGYLDNVTSAIQTQIDAKAPSSTAVTLTGTQTLTNKTLTNPVIASVINNTLTSATGDIIYASAANTPARLGIGSTDQVLKVTSGVPAWATPAAGGDTFTAGKNKIINGAMQIAQRGTSFNFPSGGGNRYFSADRWFTEDYQWSAGSNLTVSNDSSVYPDGFSRSIKVATGATALTLAAGGNIYLQQFIEGSNIASLYKSSNVTLSFYVRSSVTGTYSVLFTNGFYGTGTATRGLIKEYTINTANTWERKTITIDLATGTSSGTWNTNTSIGLSVQFNLGANANRVGNDYLNTWATWSDYEVQSTSSTQWTSNANATFYLTGVQLEEGATATNFQTATGTIAGEEAACQRYYYAAANGALQALFNAANYSTTAMYGNFTFPVTMRVAPTLAATSSTGYYEFARNGGVDSFNSLSAYATSANNVILNNTTEISGTVGHGGFVTTTNTFSGLVSFSAEL
jgi:hypothetical protein